MDENCKITEPMHFWTRAVDVHFVPRFDAWQKAQKNRKKWVSFNVSFTPLCQFLRRFRLFPRLLIFMCRKRDQKNVCENPDLL
jgi:hypothetical protein